MTEQLKEEFSKYKLTLIREFITTFMPVPEAGKYKFFKITTSDEFIVYVWGDDADVVLSQFKRFLNLRIFV